MGRITMLKLYSTILAYTYMSVLSPYLCLPGVYVYKRVVRDTVSDCITRMCGTT